MKRRVCVASFIIAGLLVAGVSGPSEAKDRAQGQGQPRAFLGVLLSGDRPRDEGGVRVNGVLEDSAADQAGMEGGDVIVSFDGHPVEDLTDVSDGMRSSAPGDRVAIEVLRDGQRHTLDVTLGERAPEERARPKLGVHVIETTPELRQKLGGDMDRGALVGKVLADSPAEKAGLAVGDLILSVNGRSVHNASGLVAALRDKGGETITLEVVRDHRTLHLETTLP